MVDKGMIDEICSRSQHWARDEQLGVGGWVAAHVSWLEDGRLAECKDMINRWGLCLVLACAQQSYIILVCRESARITGSSMIVQ